MDDRTRRVALQDGGGDLRSGGLGTAVPRHVLIRSDAGGSVVPETELLAEKSLHDVLTEYPALVPSEDLGMGQLIVVGRESKLESGYADLVLVDRTAQVCLVEVKKEGNPDTRRVIAQLLDYATSLWQLSTADFEETVLRPYLRQTEAAETDLPDIGSYAACGFGSEPETEPDAHGFADFGHRVQQTLASGEFRLVVAAPSPAGNLDSIRRPSCSRCGPPAIGRRLHLERRRGRDTIVRVGDFQMADSASWLI